jgi:hypothetical protein
LVLLLLLLPAQVCRVYEGVPALRRQLRACAPPVLRWSVPDCCHTLLIAMQTRTVAAARWIDPVAGDAQVAVCVVVILLLVALLLLLKFLN